MSPALAHGCPDTPRQALLYQPRVRAGLYMPRGLLPKGAPSHVPVEAPCSALADDTTEERLCPYTYGSAMLRIGDKQLRAAHGRIILRSPELNVWHHRNTSPRERHMRGMDMGAAPGSRPSAHHPARSLGPGHRAPLPERSQGMKTRLSVKGDS